VPMSGGAPRVGDPIKKLKKLPVGWGKKEKPNRNRDKQPKKRGTENRSPTERVPNDSNLKLKKRPRDQGAEKKNRWRTKGNGADKKEGELCAVKGGGEDGPKPEEGEKQEGGGGGGNLNKTRGNSPIVFRNLGPSQVFRYREKKRLLEKGEKGAT